MQYNEIFPGIEIHGLTLYLRNVKTLVFADLHLGYEEELMSFGYLVPRFQYKMILRYLEKILSGVDVGKVVIDGDLKHEFGRISGQEWREVRDFLDFLGGRVDEIILVRGNHDNIIGPIATRKRVRVVSGCFIEEEGIYITHGHEIPEDKNLGRAKTILIAHDHPAISLGEGLRVERIKCFLKGKWNKKTLIQIPSLNFVTEGMDITRENPLSPFMNQNLGDFEAYGIEGFNIFHFEKLKHISR